MGNSINRSTNQTSDKHQPNNSQQRTNNNNLDNQTTSDQPTPNRSRLRFSTSLLSLSNFTSKHFSRSSRSYSVTNVHQPTNASKGQHQRFGWNFGIVKTRSLHIINRSHSHLVHLTRSLPHISVPRFLTRSTSKLTSDELAAQSKTIWPTPTIILLFSPQFKLITEEYLQQTFEVYGVIARGAFGTVYRVIRKNDRKDCALKVLEKSQIIRDKAVLQLKNEIDIQSVCGHNAFIVKLISFWQSHREIYLLSEYIGGGELFDTIRKFPHKLVQLYVAEIAVALDFLHNAGVIYRDLKPENILLDNNFHIKLIDFGLSKFLKIGKRTHTICGTPQYMAPEILIGLRSGRFIEYDHCVDWFSLGVVACRMLTNQYPEIVFSDESPNNNNRSMSMVGFDVIDDSNAISSINSISSSQTMSSIGGECNVRSFQKTDGSTVLPAESVTLPIECKDLLNRLLEYKPERRIRSIFGLQRIAFFMNFSFDDVRKQKILPLDLMDSTEIY